VANQDSNSQKAKNGLLYMGMVLLIVGTIGMFALVSGSSFSIELIVTVVGFFSFIWAFDPEPGITTKARATLS